MRRPRVAVIVIVLCSGACNAGPGAVTSGPSVATSVIDTKGTPATISSVATTPPSTSTTVSSVATTLSKRDDACRAYYGDFVSLSDQAAVTFSNVEEIMVGASEGLYGPLGVTSLLNNEADTLREIKYSLDDLSNPPASMEASVTVFRNAMAAAEEALRDAAFWIGVGRSGYADSVDEARVSYQESVNLARFTIISLPAC